MRNKLIHVMNPYFTCITTSFPSLKHAHVAIRKQTPLRSPKTGVTHRHNCLHMIAMQQPSAGTRWTKKGRRSKNGTRAIITGSLAHLWLSSAPVHLPSCCVSRMPLYKEAGGEKQTQRATKRCGKVHNVTCSLPAQRSTTPMKIYCPTTRF